MPTWIRKPFSQKFLHIDIDPGGMSIGWTDMLYATPFATPAEAKHFVETRLSERYPDEKVMYETIS